MRQIRFAVSTGLVLMLIACGSSRPPQNINGAWFALLKNPDGSTAFTFQTTLTQDSGTAVGVTNFTFEPAPLCFVATTSETATFSSTGSSNGIVTGTLTMTVSTTFPVVQNVLTLQGTVNTGLATPGSISGTWSLTGQPGCSGTSGTFTMNQPVVDPP
jgi:hypothetical protein